MYKCCNFIKGVMCSYEVDTLLVQDNDNVGDCINCGSHINWVEVREWLSEDEKKDALIFRLQYCGVDDFNEMRKEFGRRLRLQDKKRLMGFGKGEQ